jgi:hypothetical protein
MELGAARGARPTALRQLTRRRTAAAIAAARRSAFARCLTIPLNPLLGRAEKDL